jgi:hypothetical protein
MNILQKIKTGDCELPPRTLLAGPEGIGKTTFAAKAPKALFLAAEDGLTGFSDIPRFTPTTLEEMYNFVDALIADPNGYRHLVVDTTDWLERFMSNAICVRDSKSNIEDYGYGKGYVVLETEFVKFLQRLDILRAKQKLGIILLSHVQIRTFNSPTGESWERFEMKGHKRFTGILREWTDAVLFAVHEVFKTKEKGAIREKAIGGDRVIHTTWSPAWDAKNRLNLPETLPLEWDDYTEACGANSTTALRERVRKLWEAKKEKVTGADMDKWTKSIAGIDKLTADRLKVALSKLDAL